MITERKHKCELFTGIMVINVQKALGRWMRKAFHRIVYVERKKYVPMYTPQLHVLNLLEN